MMAAQWKRKGRTALLTAATAYLLLLCLYPLAISPFCGTSSSGRPMVCLNTAFPWEAIVSAIYYPALVVERKLYGTEVYVVYDPDCSEQMFPRNIRAR